ncbi:uncharacterized protein EI97DRAFT_463839 [Westerdykella ornata]|uniref:Uncharacterized protein n=1 Tax=Westerdykella ornata TaxID=318751 RepID=A0A6A6JZ89_WESOR|nr:uncharacterized protein EI97DRAFT_463839 [Westerdykella ornata]KAF2281525.1 hypothetical protein EI97DRAFT_463839 [Westerdykella ornata]
MNICVFTTSDITPEEDVTFLTPSLASPITTSFKSIPWLEIKDRFRILSDPVDDKIYTQFFLILDAQLSQDRKVTIVQRDVEYVTPEGRVCLAGLGTRQDLKKMWVWKRHRVPFEET